MDELIIEQLEWLLAQNSTGNRLDRLIITLVGFLADGKVPPELSDQLARLSRQVKMRDIFDSLVDSLKLCVQNRNKPTTAKDGDTGTQIEIESLIRQVEAARNDLAQSPDVSQAEIISWIVAQARERKLLQKRYGRR